MNPKQPLEIHVGLKELPGELGVMVFYKYFTLTGCGS
jgi:hypothetical protein